ncbi:MAG: carbon starvation CstA family protein, partial [Planctomycetota bacterium]
VQWDPADAPMIFPFLFITIACGAISGFHCLVSSGTSSKQLKNEKDAQFIGFGSMLTEGFLATLVILACCAGLGLGTSLNFSTFKQHGEVVADTSHFNGADGREYKLDMWGPVGAWSDFELFGGDQNSEEWDSSKTTTHESGIVTAGPSDTPVLISAAAWNTRYSTWTASNALASKVGAFVDGSANFLKAMGIPAGIAVALMGVLVASFAGTTLDTACRLQRYVVQELARTLLPKLGPNDCPACGYDLTGNTSGACPECGVVVSADGGTGFQPVMDAAEQKQNDRLEACPTNLYNPITWLTNKHGATIFAILIAAAIAAMPAPGNEWSVANAGKGGLILWPMFGATNQLLGGLAFLVITFYLWRRGKAVWFVVLPLAFMIVVPAWAMVLQLAGWLPALPDKATWLAAWLAYPAVFFREANWVLIIMAVATLVLEAWMLVEAALLFPKARGVLEEGGEAMPG